MTAGATISTWRRPRSWSATTLPPTYATSPETNTVNVRRGDIVEEVKAYRESRHGTNGQRSSGRCLDRRPLWAREGTEYPPPGRPCARHCSNCTTNVAYYVPVCVNGLTEAVRARKRRVSLAVKLVLWLYLSHLLYVFCSSLLRSC